MDVKTVYTLTLKAIRDLRNCLKQLKYRVGSLERRLNADVRGGQREDIIVGDAEDDIPGAQIEENPDGSVCLIPGRGYITQYKLSHENDSESFCSLSCSKEVWNWSCFPIPARSAITAHRIWNSCGHFKIVNADDCRSKIFPAKATVTPATADLVGDADNAPGFIYEITLEDGFVIDDAYDPASGPCTEHLRRYAGKRDPAVCCDVVINCCDEEVSIRNLHEERVAKLCVNDDDPDPDPDPELCCQFPDGSIANISGQACTSAGGVEVPCLPITP